MTPHLKCPMDIDCPDQIAIIFLHMPNEKGVKLLSLVFFMEGCAAYIGLIFAIFDKQHTR
jgi:hypothetical protein